jgi:hypothetical protein
MGILFVLEGTAANNLKVTLECSISVKKEVRKVNQGYLFH